MANYQVVNECVEQETGRRLYPGDTVSLGDEEGKRLMDANCLKLIDGADVEVAAVQPPENAAQRTGGLSNMTKKQLYDVAARRDIEGRSGMSKDELTEALKGGE